MAPLTAILTDDAFPRPTQRESRFSSTMSSSSSSSLTAIVGTTDDAPPLETLIDAVIVEEDDDADDDDAPPAALVAFDRPTPRRSNSFVSNSSGPTPATRSLSSSLSSSFASFASPSKTVPIFVDLDALLTRQSTKKTTTFLGDLAVKLEAIDYAPRFVATSCRRVKESNLLDTLGKEVDARFYRACGPNWRTHALQNHEEDSDASQRVAGIRAWLAERSHVRLYLVVDGYDLVEESDLNEEHYVAADEMLSVDRAMALIKQQDRQKIKQTETTETRFTAEEWDLLKKSPLSIEVLRKDSCPFWQIQAAQVYLRKVSKGDQRSSKGANIKGRFFHRSRPHNNAGPPGASSSSRGGAASGKDGIIAAAAVEGKKTKKSAALGSSDSFSGSSEKHTAVNPEAMAGALPGGHQPCCVLA